jgi:iron(III) transport system permease protein
MISVITACISVGLAINFAYAVRIKQRLFWVNRRLGFGYAITGAVMAIGILSFLEVFDLAWWMSTSIWILIYAYVVRFLASSIYSIEAGLLRITVSIDQSAAILGLTKYQILKKIHLPLLSRSVGIAGIFVFVDVMKELPATMLLRPFNYDTLAIKIYQLASDERLIELALPALTIVIVGLIPVVLLTQVMEHSS